MALPITKSEKPKRENSLFSENFVKASVVILCPSVVVIPEVQSDGSSSVELDTIKVVEGGDFVVVFLFLEVVETEGVVVGHFGVVFLFFEVLVKTEDVVLFTVVRTDSGGVTFDVESFSVVGADFDVFTVVVTVSEVFGGAEFDVVCGKVIFGKIILS